MRPAVGGPKDSAELQAHMVGTYISLRYGLAMIGAALPIVLWVVGAINGLGLGFAKSISEYYWVASAGDPPSRNWLVGLLFAVAACLYLYKGFTTAENWALNGAAIFALGVALIPTPWNCKPCPFTLHGTSAILLFLCLVYVVWFRAADTLDLLDDAARAARYRRTYRIIGAAMLASPVIAFVVNWATRGDSYTFFIETAGIWAFAWFWWTKSRELKQSSATVDAVRGAVEIEPDGKARRAPHAAQGPQPRIAA
jgi:hypothetical protein